MVTIINLMCVSLQLKKLYSIKKTKLQNRYRETMEGRKKLSIEYP